MSVLTSSNVIPRLVPGIHVFAVAEDVDGRNKCGHDVCEKCCASDEERTS
jgi:hypothetical protein